MTWDGHVIQVLLFLKGSMVINTMPLYAHLFTHAVIFETITGQKATVIYMKM